MMTTLKANDLCMNCFKPGHYVKQCKSLHRCRKCQKQHHTLLHIESKEPPPTPTTAPASDSIVNSVPVHTTTGITSNSLLMTCRVLVDAPDGKSVEARALLDCASSASFISERLARSLCLAQSSQNVRISGAAGLSQSSRFQSIASFSISSGIQLSDPTFGHPGRIDILLGVDIFTQVLLQGWRIGPGAPVAFETIFG